MKKIRVLLLVCVFVFSFTTIGFAAKGATVELQVSNEPKKFKEKVLDYEVTYYKTDGRGGYMLGPVKRYYKEITFENGYEMTHVQRETIGARDGSGYWIIRKFNYKTY